MTGGQSHEKTEQRRFSIKEPAQVHQYRWAYLLLTVGYLFVYIWSQFEADNCRLVSLTGLYCIVAIHIEHRILGQSFTQLCLPKSRRTEVLTITHDTFDGHLGAKGPKNVYGYHLHGPH